MYLVRFLRREDTGASRLPDLLHQIPEFLLLQGLVRLAFAGVVLHRFLQAARTACVHRGRLLISLFRSFSLTCDFRLSLFLFSFILYSQPGSVSSGRGLRLRFAHLLISALICSSTTFRRVNRERAVIPHRANSACMPDQEERVRRTLRKSRLLPFDKKYSKESPSLKLRDKIHSFSKHFPIFLIYNKLNILSLKFCFNNLLIDIKRINRIN